MRFGCQNRVDSSSQAGVETTALLVLLFDMEMIIQTDRRRRTVEPGNFLIQ